MSVSEPIRQTDDGVLLDVEVIPGAPEDRFPDGYNPWRARVKAKVQAQAQQGEANRALCELVADHLDLATGAVAVASGHTSRQKTLVLRGMGAEDLRQRLRGVLEA